MGSSPLISVVIPTLNAEKEIGSLLNILKEQTLTPFEILVVDSSSDDQTRKEVAKHPEVAFVVIDRSDFNHGLTRDMALRRTTGEFVCFLTQDARPASSSYLHCLIAPMLQNSNIALVSGRQLPKGDARRFEQLVRDFNYPDRSSVRTMEDLGRMGIKTFFASDVCSAYRRSAYLHCGGFPALNTNEDMLMAARFIAAGYSVAYESSAKVYHSHNLTPRQQFERNKAVGYFLESNKEELMHASEIGEGGRLVRSISKQLLDERKFGELVSFGVDCAARLMGNRKGRALARKDGRSE